jgi:hypothetical protein
MNIERERQKLAERVASEIGLDYSGRITPLAVAEWVLTQYKPPIEWVEIPPTENVGDPVAIRYNWRIQVKTIIANRVFEMSHWQTPEQRRRDPDGTKRLKRHIRSTLGRSVFSWLDGEEESDA